jgi:hypothetical protein
MTMKNVILLCCNAIVIRRERDDSEKRMSPSSGQKSKPSHYINDVNYTMRTVFHTHHLIVGVFNSWIVGMVNAWCKQKF